jgi:asparagine synthase (glutamine-hydrolysing)
MQEQSMTPVRTFTIGFKEQRWNEAHYARQIADHLNTEHTEFCVTPRDALRVIPRLPEIYDEPFADSSQIPTFLVSELARRNVTVSLAGDGADELFGGYEHHRLLLRRYHQTGWLVALFDQIAKSFPNHRTTVSKGLNGLGRAPWQSLGVFGQKIASLARLLDSEKRANVFLEQVSFWKEPAALVVDGSEPPTVMNDPAQWACIQHFTAQMMFLDQMLYLPDDLLTKVDRASMRVGLELRVPYLDPRLVAFVWSLPVAWNVDQTRSKKLLRRVLYRYVPPAFIERPKMGFTMPLAEWLRSDLREWAEGLLDTRRLQQEGFFRPGPIRQVWEGHVSGTFPGRHNYLWSVLMFQAWLEHNRH